MLQQIDKPYLVAVNGTAAAAGMDMALLGDMIFAAESARFGETYIRMGVVPGDGGGWLLPRLVGTQRALEMLWLGDFIDAREAERIGLVNKVVPVKKLEAEGVAWAQEILQRSPLAIRCLKSAFNAELDGQSGIQELAGNATMLYYMTEEAKEFMTAQKEKRKPKSAKFPWLP
jgi:naphthoate synthase